MKNSYFGMMPDIITLRETAKGIADPEFVRQYKMLEEVSSNATMLIEAAKGMADPEFVRQYKVFEKITPTLADLREASVAIAQISPTYLRSINQALEIFKHVDMATLSRSPGLARELIPAAVATQKFLGKMNTLEPAVTEKTFKALDTQTLDDEPILPPEAPKETDGLIATLKEIVIKKPSKDVATVIQTLNSVLGDSLHDSTVWNILLWMSVIIVFVDFFLRSSDEEARKQ